MCYQYGSDGCAKMPRFVIMLLNKYHHSVKANSDQHELELPTLLISELLNIEIIDSNSKFYLSVQRKVKRNQ